MFFLNPPLLAGLAAALVPLVVHLLNRSRYRNVDWGAMMFLQAVEPRADHAARLKQWGLLSIRTAIVGVLAFALARPVVYPRGEPPRRPGRTAAVILLDRSSSMALNDNGRPRIDLARDAVYQLLSPGFARGDDLWLLPLGDGNAAPVYATDPQDMARRVRETAPPSGEADVAAGLDAALALLGESAAPNREIYVVTDHQALSWAGVDDAFDRRWRGKVASDARRPRVTLVPVGTDEAGNVAVTSVSTSADALVANGTYDVEVTVRNFGSVPRAAVGLTLSLLTPAGRTVVARPNALRLPALAEVTRTIPVAFGDAGCYVLTAVVDASGATTDRSLSRSVDVEPPARVLVVDGDEREGGFGSASEFLRAALTPYRDKRDPFTVEVVHPDAWVAAELSAYRVVVLANVPALSEGQARAVEQFASDGGGVVVLPGDQTRVEQYDTQIRWLPARLSPAGAEGETAPTDLLQPAAGPGARFFAGGRSEAGGVTVRRYFGATLKPGAVTLAQYGDGKPFVIASAVGRGRVVLMTTPVDPDWNALPLTPLFLPFAQSLVAYAGGGLSAWREAGWNRVVGEPLHARLDGVIDALSVRLETPSGGRVSEPLAIDALPDATEVTYARAAVPGVYRLTTRSGGAADPAAIRFSVRTPVAESDLTPLTPARQEHLAGVLDAHWTDPDARPLPAAQEAARAGWTLWLAGVAAVIGLCVIELAAVRRWSGGAA